MKVRKKCSQTNLNRKQWWKFHLVSWLQYIYCAYYIFWIGFVSRKFMHQWLWVWSNDFVMSECETCENDPLVGESIVLCVGSARLHRLYYIDQGRLTICAISSICLYSRAFACRVEQSLSQHNRIFTSFCLYFFVYISNNFFEWTKKMLELPRIVGSNY